MKNFIKGLKIAIIVLLVIILVGNLCIMIQSKSNPDKVPSIFGFKPFIVTSGSMESEISVGDLVFVKNIDPKELKVNDIIAFRDSENLVTTHRIISEINLDNKKCYKTKGDNNNVEDDIAVCESQVEGKYVGKIKRVGYAILFIQKPLGFIVMMLSILIICMIIYFISNKNENKLSEEELKEFEEFRKARRKKLEKKTK